MKENRGGYGQFCPVAVPSEIICTRWTMLLIRELLAGNRHFNQLRRGVPRMSPALLSKRLKELEIAGVIPRIEEPASSGTANPLTAAGNELGEIVGAVGRWRQRWVESQLSLRNMDPSLFMWDMRRNLNLDPISSRDYVIQFLYSDLSKSKQNFWLLIVDGEVDLCYTDPGKEVDLYVVTELYTMTAIWMGISTVKSELAHGRLELVGNRNLRQSIQNWLGLSPFANEKRQVVA